MLALHNQKKYNPPKSKGLNFEIAAPKIHNRFDIWKKNVETGQEEQIAYAENIVLNQMFNRLCSFLTYFSHIRYGTGTGELLASRTSLFNDLGYKAVTNVAKNYAIPTSSWQQSIELGLTDAVGAVITEVGIAYGTSSTNLVTHAMLRDMNGNPISITKTAIDILTIYATVYFTLDNSHPSLKMYYPTDNDLIRYLMGGTAPDPNLYAGESRATPDWPGRLMGSSEYGLGISGAGTWSADVANKRVTLATPRFGATQANGHIKEIDLAHVCRLSLPASGIYAGLDIVGASVGVGDGIKTTYLLPSRNIKDSGLTIKIDGVATTAFTKSLINRSADSEMHIYDFDTDFCGVIGISDDGLLCCQKRASGYKLYDFVNGVWIARAQTPVGGWPTADLGRIMFSTDKSVLMIGANVYDFTGGQWIKRPALTVPGGAYLSYNGTALSGDGKVLAIMTNANPRCYVVDWSGTEWIARPQPSFSTSYTSNYINLNADGSVIVGKMYNVIRSYTWDGSAWTMRTDGSLGSSANLIANLACDTVIYTGEAWDVNHLICKRYINNAWTTIANAVGGSVGSFGALASSRDLSRSILGVNNAVPYVEVWAFENDTFINLAPSVIRASSGYTSTAASAVAGDGSYAAIFDVASGTGCRYSFPLSTTQIVFDSPPANGAAITADYTVDGIHKTSTRVIDMTFTIQFGIPI